MEMNIQGHIVPPMWYYTVANDSGKSYMLAIAILADIVAEYQIREKRDDTTDELLERSYLYYEALLNEEHKNIQRAIAFLEKKDIVKRIYRTIQGANGRFQGSVLLLHINLDVLYEITYPMEISKRVKKKKKTTRKREKRDGQDCSTMKNAITERSEHKCLRCPLCLVCSEIPVYVEDMDIELTELAVQYAIEKIYEEE